MCNAIKKKDIRDFRYQTCRHAARGVAGREGRGVVHVSPRVGVHWGLFSCFLCTESQAQTTSNTIHNTVIAQWATVAATIYRVQ